MVVVIEVDDSNSDTVTGLHGDALGHALERRFVLVSESVTLDAPSGPHTIQLRKPQNADTLISEADYAVDERLPYWADLWPSARRLATTMLAQKGEGRSLVELGCGLGLASIAAQVAGFDVTATDYYTDALDVARWNAWRNTGREPATRMVNWRELPNPFGPFDVVIAADVLYERPYGTLVAEAIAVALKPGGEAWVTDPGRTALDTFLEQANLQGLRVASREEFPYEEGEKIRQTIRLFRLVWE